MTEARPGDEITIEALLRPYRGESIVRQIPVKIPTSTPKGTLRILVSDGDTLDKLHRVSGPMSHHLDLGSTIAMLNKEHTNSEVYVSLLEANPSSDGGRQSHAHVAAVGDERDGRPARHARHDRGRRIGGGRSRHAG